MKIHNVRLGLATNSSSSHSLIWLPNARDEWDGDLTFGWEDFTLASVEAKNGYLAAILWQNLQAPEMIKAAVIHELFGVSTYHDQSIYIDHQSAIILPRAYRAWRYEPKTLDEEFLKDLIAYLQTPGLVILGGNDNSEGHPLAGGNSFSLPDGLEYREQIARKDSRGYWTLFDPQTGAKVRFSFDGKLDQPDPVKADAPELVDIKITDTCPFGCDFCFQGSTPDGKSGMTLEKDDMGFAWQLPLALAELKVFEVAIGGGEPTLEKGFASLLEDFRDHDIVPNFTTRSTLWLKDDKQREKILEHAGAIAFSVRSAAEIKRLDTLLQKYNLGGSYKFTVQMVMGLQTRAQFEAALIAAREAKLRVTLLGYKTTGRGKDVKPKNYGWWLDSLKKLEADRKLGQISIDTTLAAAYEKQIEAAGIPSWLFHTQEGKFSCYIDAVESKIGPSSYCQPEQMIVLTDRRVLPEQIRKAFATF
jgi:organic radical activating enzyme